MIDKIGFKRLKKEKWNSGHKFTLQMFLLENEENISYNVPWNSLNYFKLKTVLYDYWFIEISLKIWE